MNETKLLNKAYTKRFKQLTKNILTSKGAGLAIFVEHLKYLRDAYILTQKSVDTIVTLNAAIEEFEAYIKTKKDFHWNNFCEFLKHNIKEWLAVDDSV
jgi:hypothetical protein